MGRGALVLYRDTPENAEVAGDAGIPFEPEELAAKIELVLAMRPSSAKRCAAGARARARALFLGRRHRRLRKPDWPACGSGSPHFGSLCAA